MVRRRVDKNVESYRFSSRLVRKVKVTLEKPVTVRCGKVAEVCASLERLQAETQFARTSTSLSTDSHRFWRFTIAQGGRCWLIVHRAVHARYFALLWLTRCALTPSRLGRTTHHCKRSQQSCTLSVE